MTDTRFISYSRSDVDPEWIESFAGALQDRQINIWLDEWDIKPGDRIADAGSLRFVGATPSSSLSTRR